MLYVGETSPILPIPDRNFVSFKHKRLVFWNLDNYKIQETGTKCNALCGWNFTHITYPGRPRMEKSHSCWPRTAWCVVNMFHKNGMRPLIITNGTICYSTLYCNSPWLYNRQKYVYSVISVKLDWLPGNSKKWTIDMFVAFGVRFFHSWADRNFVSFKHKRLVFWNLVQPRLQLATSDVCTHTHTHTHRHTHIDTRVAVCCSVLQSVAECCSVLQCVAVCCSVLRRKYRVL